MGVCREVLFPFLVDTFADNGARKELGDEEMTEEDELLDCRLTVVNDLVLEIFEKVRDIYCVLESL